MLPGVNSQSLLHHCCSRKSQWPTPSRSVRVAFVGMITTLISNEVKRGIKPFYSGVTGGNRIHYTEQWPSQQVGCVDRDPGREQTPSPQFSYLAIKYLFFQLLLWSKQTCKVVYSLHLEVARIWEFCSPSTLFCKVSLYSHLDSERWEKSCIQRHVCPQPERADKNLAASRWSRQDPDLGLNRGAEIRGHQTCSKCRMGSHLWAKWWLTSSYFYLLLYTGSQAKGTLELEVLLLAGPCW